MEKKMLYEGAFVWMIDINIKGMICLNDKTNEYNVVYYKNGVIIERDLNELLDSDLIRNYSYQDFKKGQIFESDKLKIKAIGIGLNSCVIISSSNNDYPLGEILFTHAIHDWKKPRSSNINDSFLDEKSELWKFFDDHFKYEYKCKI